MIKKQKIVQLLTQSHSKKSLLIVCFLFACLNVNSQSDKYDWSLKLGGGKALIINNDNTRNWIGNLNGSFFFLGFGFKNFHLNAAFKYFGEPTKTDLSYDNKVLPRRAKFNFVFFDLTISYEKELISRLFIEPYLGYVANNITSNIIHPNGEKLDIRNTYGATIGLNVIKYIKISENGGFLGPFISTNYNIINFKEVSSELDNNAIGLSFGVILKGIDNKYLSQNNSSKKTKIVPPPF